MGSEIRLDGNVGRDPDIKFFDNGGKVANFPVGIDDMKREDGKWVKTGTTWFRVAVWGDDGEAVAEHVKKGDRVLVSGGFKITTYEKDGATVPTIEVTARSVAVVPKKIKKAEQGGDEPW